MALLTIKQNPVYNLELTEKELETLFRLLGNHIIGQGDAKNTLDIIHGGIRDAVGYGCFSEKELEIKSNNRSDALYIVGE